MTTGEKIARLRKGQNLSQEEFAEQLGISRQTVSKWENGTALPTSENLMLIAEKFSLPVSALYSTENNAEKTEETENTRIKEPKGNRNIFVYAGLLLILAFQMTVIFDLYTELERLEDTTARLYEQLGSINIRMDRLHSQAEPRTEQFTHYEYEVLYYDRQTNMLTLRVLIVPTDYSSTAQARLMATTSQGTHSAQAVLKDHTFEAELEIYREENTPLYLYLTDGDRVRSYLMDYLPDLTADYRLDIVRAAVIGTKVMVKENGALDMRNGRIELTYKYTVDTENENVTVYPEIAVLEIYADGWLIEQRAMEKVADQDFYALAARQESYTEGEAWRGTAYGYQSLNEKEIGLYTVIENENIKENSEITFKIIFVDNHGVRYEEYINYNSGN